MGLPGHYVLDDLGEPVPCEDLPKWAKWMATADRHVGDDEVGDLRISTVFLGLDHNFHGGPPVLWETMIFGPGELNDYQQRYASRLAALKGHVDAVARAYSAQRPKLQLVP